MGSPELSPKGFGALGLRGMMMMMMMMEKGVEFSGFRGC